MNRTAKTIIRIFYFVALVWVCIAAVGAYLFVRIDGKMEDGRGKYELISANCEKIGKRYGNYTAPDGENYYCITVETKNIGQYAEKADHVYFTFTAEDGTLCIREYGDYDNVVWDAVPVVPAGRTSVVENIVRIPDGCKKVSVAFGMDTDGEGSAEVSVK